MLCSKVIPFFSFRVFGRPLHRGSRLPPISRERKVKWEKNLAEVVFSLRPTYKPKISKIERPQVNSICWILIFLPAFALKKTLRFGCKKVVNRQKSVKIPFYPFRTIGTPVSPIYYWPIKLLKINLWSSFLARTTFPYLVLQFKLFKSFLLRSYP